MEETTMKNILGLSRKFVILGVMLFALGFMTFTDVGTTPQGAAPCCSECETRYDDCIAGGGDPTYCANWANSCWRWCSFSC
jgi:hypothetical protein